METGAVKIDISTKISNKNSTLNLNTVCINLSHRFKTFVIHKCHKSDNIITCTGFHPAPPLSISQICLNLYTYEFTPINLVPLINSRLHDPPLSKRIADGIAARATFSVGYLQPLFMSVDVVFTQDVFSVKPVSCLPREETQEEEDHSTCPICLEDMCNDDGDDDKQIQILPQCSHQFHQICILKWLINRDSCPICRQSVQRNRF